MGSVLDSLIVQIFSLLGEQVEGNSIHPLLLLLTTQLGKY